MWFMAEIEIPRRLSSPTVSVADSIPDTLENLAAKAQNLAERKQKARRRFKSAVYSILMLQFMKSSIPIRIERAKRDPYGIRPIRVFIDNAAFRLVPLFILLFLPLILTFQSIWPLGEETQWYSRAECPFSEKYSSYRSRT